MYGVYVKSGCDFYHMAFAFSFISFENQLRIALDMCIFDITYLRAVL